jgi:hypothetical protein
MLRKPVKEYLPALEKVYREEFDAAEERENP